MVVQLTAKYLSVCEKYLSVCEFLQGLQKYRYVYEKVLPSRSFNWKAGGRGADSFLPQNLSNFFHLLETVYSQIFHDLFFLALLQLKYPNYLKVLVQLIQSSPLIIVTALSSLHKISSKLSFYLFSYVHIVFFFSGR